MDEFRQIAKQLDVYVAASTELPVCAHKKLLAGKKDVVDLCIEAEAVLPHVENAVARHVLKSRYLLLVGQRFCELRKFGGSDVFKRALRDVSISQVDGSSKSLATYLSERGIKPFEESHIAREVAAKPRRDEFHDRDYVFL